MERNEKYFYCILYKSIFLRLLNIELLLGCTSTETPLKKSRAARQVTFDPDWRHTISSASQERKERPEGVLKPTDIRNYARWRNHAY